MKLKDKVKLSPVKYSITTHNWKTAVEWIREARGECQPVRTVDWKAKMFTTPDHRNGMGNELGLDLRALQAIVVSDWQFPSKSYVDDDSIQTDTNNVLVNTR